MNESNRDGDILVKNRAKGKHHVCCDRAYLFTRTELQGSDLSQRLGDKGHNLTVRLVPRIL
jgi:hypothetical protein